MGLLKNTSHDVYTKIFGDLKKEISILDPVSFAENNLTIDGRPFRMSGNGWKFMADLYREVAVQATSPNAKPCVILKGRQVGATVLAAVLSLYFTSSGLYGTGPDRPPMRILHAFPTLGIMSKYAKDKLKPMVQGSQDDFIMRRSLKNDDKFGKSAGEDTLTEYTFVGFNKLRVESTGRDGGRLRGLTEDGIFFDECFPYNQCIETEDGKMEIGAIHKIWSNGGSLPKVKTFNETTSNFEYKNITNAWNRGKKPLIQITCGNREIRCTANHPFLTERGWVDAGDLSVGDRLRTSPGTPQYIRSLNDDQMQIALGSFLGDGRISSHKEGSSRLTVCHGIKQLDYCSWKASMFDSKLTYLEKNGYSQTPAVRFCTTSFGFDRLPDTKTHCPQWVLDKLDARGLAVWFMDDGSAQAHNRAANISTCSFDEDSQKRIVEKLKTFGIDSRYACYDGYFSIFLGKAGYTKLCEVISPYVHPNLSYKLYNDRTESHYVWNNKFNSYGISCVDRISSLSDCEEVYDIEVEDNHNFIITSGRTSKNVGGPIAHNCQDMTKEAIETAVRILTTAQYGPPTQGVQLYFGTPKNTGSYFFRLWEESDQRYYQLGCGGCEEHFFFHTIGSDEWKTIWLSGHDVQCPKCGHIQNKTEAIERGRWKATKDSSKCKYVGYHLNIMLNPKFTKEAVLDYDPSVNRNRGEKSWRNETLGEFYSGGSTPLTMDEIYAHCIDKDRGIAKAIKSGTDKTIVMGIDWGGKDFDDGGNSESSEDDAKPGGQSYTAICILSIDQKGVFTIENAYRLKRNDFAYKIEVIQELYRRFNIKICAADFFYGQDVVNHMQVGLNYGNRFIGCINSGNLGTLLNYKPKDMRVTLNKDMMIEEVFSLIRKDRIKFPAKDTSFDALYWLMEHCTSMEVKTIKRNENFIRKYEKGAIPNDGLMAMMYAIIAYKFIATNGFKTTETTKKVSSGRPGPILVYAPRLK